MRLVAGAMIAAVVSVIPLVQQQLTLHLLAILALALATVASAVKL
jgi:hypothetical protein